MEVVAQNVEMVVVIVAHILEKLVVVVDLVVEVIIKSNQVKAQRKEVAVAVAAV